MPRVQPDGFAIGRGSRERVRGPRGARRPGIQAPPIEFVGATKASFPLSGTGGFELTVTLPTDPNVEDGDWMVGALATSGPAASAFSTPGWFQVDFGDLIIIARIASSEPASYTFTGSGFSSGVARSGVLNTYRNISAVGAQAQNDGSLSVSDLTNAKTGSALVSFVKGRSTLTSEPWVVDPPMTQGKQHTGACLLPYCRNTHLASAFELNLPAGLITGRGYSWGGLGGPSAFETYGVILEPL